MKSLPTVVAVALTLLPQLSFSQAQDTKKDPCFRPNIEIRYLPQGRSPMDLAEGMRGFATKLTQIRADYLNPVCPKYAPAGYSWELAFFDTASDAKVAVTSLMKWLDVAKMDEVLTKDERAQANARSNDGKTTFIAYVGGEESYMKALKRAAETAVSKEATPNLAPIQTLAQQLETEVAQLVSLRFSHVEMQAANKLKDGTYVYDKGYLDSKRFDTHKRTAVGIAVAMAEWLEQLDIKQPSTRYEQSIARAQSETAKSSRSGKEALDKMQSDIEALKK